MGEVLTHKAGVQDNFQEIDVKHSLGISIMPLSSDRVLLEQRGDPLLTFGFPFAGRLPLSFLQDELLVGGLGLVLVVDSSRHVLPKSDATREPKSDLACSYELKLVQSHKTGTTRGQ